MAPLALSAAINRSRARDGSARTDHVRRLDSRRSSRHARDNLRAWRRIGGRTLFAGSPRVPIVITTGPEGDFDSGNWRRRTPRDSSPLGLGPIGSAVRPPRSRALSIGPGAGIFAALKFISIAVISSRRDGSREKVLVDKDTTFVLNAGSAEAGHEIIFSVAAICTRRGQLHSDGARCEVIARQSDFRFRRRCRLSARAFRRDFSARIPPADARYSTQMLLISAISTARLCWKARWSYETKTLRAEFS